MTPQQIYKKDIEMFGTNNELGFVIGMIIALGVSGVILVVIGYLIIKII